MIWISVKESLPENNDRVMICSMDAINTYAYPYCYEDACEMGFYENDKWWSDTRFEMIESSQGHFGLRKIINEEWTWDLEDVTHWSPLLPEPKVGA